MSGSINASYFVNTTFEEINFSKECIMGRKNEPKIKKADQKVTNGVSDDPVFYNDQIGKNNEPAKTLEKGKG